MAIVARQLQNITEQAWWLVYGLVIDNREELVVVKDYQSWSQGREVHWNTETRLPPVGVWLWIRLPDCAPVRVKRKSWMTSANGTPEYVTEGGQVISGNFNWTIC